ncbi:hypothetical protein [Jiangella alkaliphila]|uniref:MYXO-CTERM domain-containing protein n=1 Tax=Jiangella alkaliphila TaxID=419479 RepID=A0A1H2K312_9ACTN|nr:hypothetical protein [Jiangella alkaliphila]SDU62942.1 hypothetical protein SAMN04488563_3355 [Jiangella alkaliphila]
MSEAVYEPDPAVIAADLADDGIHVDPTLAELVSADDLAAQVDGADPAVFVLAVPLDYSVDVSANQLVALVREELPAGGDGVYFVSAGSVESGWRTDTTSYGVSTNNENALATYVAGDLYPSSLGDQLAETVEIFTSGDAEAVYEEQFPERATSGSGSDSDDGGVGPVVLGVGLAVAAVAAVVALLLRRRGPRGDVELKRRALQRISSAQTREWRRRAETETAALGERIRALEIERGDDSATWAAALDHYQAATAILDRSDAAADAIGALVLARRGDDALGHAADGSSWTPAVACFFNPLHGPATTKAKWRTAAGNRDVPCCEACRRDIGKRREPEILDLPTGDTVVHYMDSGAEPWASTGFGALAPDLLDRLQERPR